MKTLIFSITLSLLYQVGRCSTPELPVVHEWGTFTAVVGSDGSLVPWWSPQLEGPAQLPDFVARSTMFAKGGSASLIRMETPVLYFYPREAMSPKVVVQYPQGHITEVFPTAPGFAGSLPSTVPPFAQFNASTPTTSWEIALRSPTEAASLCRVPEVGKHGQHYAHAREVPDAWLVESAGQMEHFIFYRGAGQHSLPIRAINIHDDVWHLQHDRQPELQLKAIQIKVTAEGIQWAALPSIQSAAQDPTETRSFTVATGLSSDLPSLVTTLILELTSEGLTQPEATAMVHTWKAAWMGEIGTRVLILMPGDWINETLPITITPKPLEFRRVFVARLELLDTGVESKVIELLQNWPNTTAETHDLTMSLGRIQPAAFERALAIESSRLRERSQEIQAALRH